jgi:opine dehydrogenase
LDSRLYAILQLITTSVRLSVLWAVASLPVITTDLEKAVEDADLLMTCLPAVALEGLAKQLAPLLTEPVPILLNPGSTGGAFAFQHFLQQFGAPTRPAIGETNTLTYICRKRDESVIYISSLVKNVRFAALEGPGAGTLRQLALSIYKSLVSVDSVLHTSLSNLNAILHPPGMILSIAWIEHTAGDFSFYYDAATPGVARVIGDIDRERLAIGKAWGLTLEPLPQIFAEIGSTSQAAGESGSYLRMLRESEPNKFIKAPETPDHRYLHEDIPFGLVPMSELGRAVNVPTPVMDGLIMLASSVNGRDYRGEGWTLRQLMPVSG